MENFLNRKVLLGVSGGIAAYKAAMLTRLLVKAGCEVQVVMTPSAHDFVTPLTLSTLSRRPVLTELFARDGTGAWTDHVHLARWADVLLIAPATANTLGKMAMGLCDNLLLACWLSLPERTPVFVAPAMDLEMWRDGASRSNLDRLTARGVRAIGPESGELASGLTGLGRMSEPEHIVQALREALVGGSKLSGMRMLITAGGTQEAIDPVRFIGNRSSGKMGFALAEEAALRGARVELVTGPTNLRTERPGISRTDVVSAAEMAAACKALAPSADAVVMTAAVADYRPARASDGKLKKKDAVLRIDLEPKNLDLLVLNSLRDAGAGFGTDTNKVTLLAPGKDPSALPLMSKSETARAILDRLEESL